MYCQLMKKALTILITSGGTIVQIDDVRQIANFSSGEFLSRIAEEALLAGHKVIYLYAKKAKKPFGDKFIFDPHQETASQLLKFKKFKKIFSSVENNLELVEYQTFDDYARLIKKIVSGRLIDIVFLGAAVSDYGLKARQGKISSSRDKIILKLSKNPKIIKEIKGWSKKPIFQVGFKLLSHVSDQQLIEIAYRSGLENKSDLTVANDLQKIKLVHREAALVTPENGAVKMGGPDLAQKVLNFTLRRAKVEHFETVLKIDNRIGEKYRKEWQLFSVFCRQLYNQGLMTPFFKGSEVAHGSLALRVDRGFLITSRASNKKNLKPDELVLVTSVDWRNKKVAASSASGKKPSFNAVLVQRLFDKLPKARAVVHTHNFIAGLPTTSFPETPGTAEYAEAPVKLLKHSWLINLNNHGLIAIGEDLKVVVEYVIKKSKK